MWLYCFPFTVQQDLDKFTESIMSKLISQFDCVCQKNGLYTEKNDPFHNRKI